MTTESEKSMNAFLLWTIAEQEPYFRWSRMHRPNVFRGFVYATDGRRAAMVRCEDCKPIRFCDEFVPSGPHGKFPNVLGVFEHEDFDGAEWHLLPTIRRSCQIVDVGDDPYFERHEDLKVLGVYVDRELLWPFSLLADVRVAAADEKLLFRWPTGIGILLARIANKED